MTKRILVFFAGILFLAVPVVLASEVESLFPDCEQVLTLLNSGQRLEACMAADQFLGYCASDDSTVLDPFGDLQSLAEAFTMKGEWDETEKIYLTILALQKKNTALPLEMIDTLISLEFLTAMNNNYEKALDYALQARALSRLLYADDAPEIIQYDEPLSSFYLELKRFSEAEEIEKRILAISEKNFGAESLATYNALNRRARTLLAQQKYEEAEPFILRAVQGCETSLGEKHIAMGFYYDTLARVYDGEGRYALGKDYFNKAIPLYETHLGKTSPITLAAVQAFEELKKKEAEDQPDEAIR